jgi:hypothetical protein
MPKRDKGWGSRNFVLRPGDGSRAVAKQKDGEDDVALARRKLARAQLKLHVAEEEQLQVRAKGKQEVEGARLRAARWQAKAAERVEKRAASVTRSEARLQSMLAPKASGKEPEGPVVSPTAAADALERLQRATGGDGASEALDGAAKNATASEAPKSTTRKA